MKRQKKLKNKSAGTGNVHQRNQAKRTLKSIKKRNAFLDKNPDLKMAFEARKIEYLKRLSA